MRRTDCNASLNVLQAGKMTLLSRQDELFQTGNQPIQICHLHSI